MATIQKKTAEVSIIIINYNTPDLVQSQLKALYGHGFEIVVIDNSPKPELKKAITTKFPHTIYVPSSRNLGFAGGVNRGVGNSTAEWVLLLNTDATITPKHIQMLVDTAKSAKAMVAAPRLLDVNGTAEQSVGYFDSFFKNPVNALFARPRYLKADSITTPIAIDFATGAVLLIHKTVFESVGLFDSVNFFMYFEDIDFCNRLKQQGLRVMFVPTVEVTHANGTSSNKDPVKKTQNYHTSLKKYISKHRGGFIAWLNTVTNVFN